jgi:hypothetical protein
MGVVLSVGGLYFNWHIVRYLFIFVYFGHAVRFLLLVYDFGLLLLDVGHLAFLVFGSLCVLELILSIVDDAILDRCEIIVDVSHAASLIVHYLNLLSIIMLLKSAFI